MYNESHLPGAESRLQKPRSHRCQSCSSTLTTTFEKRLRQQHQASETSQRHLQRQLTSSCTQHRSSWPSSPSPPPQSLHRNQLCVSKSLRVTPSGRIAAIATMPAASRVLAIRRLAPAAPPIPSMALESCIRYVTVIPWFLSLRQLTPRLQCRACGFPCSMCPKPFTCVNP